MKEVCLIVEGAGASKSDKSELIRSLSILLRNAGFAGKMPRIIPSGGRDQAFNDFKATLSGRQRNRFPILLIDAEDPVRFEETSLDAPVWKHLKLRDLWDQPTDAADDQVVLMVTSMETWIIADHVTLKKYFGPKFNEKALLPLPNLEKRHRKEVLANLLKATENCGRDRQYRKGSTSFLLLASLNPSTLAQHLPHFQRFLQVLNHHLK